MLQSGSRFLLAGVLLIGCVSLSSAASVAAEETDPAKETVLIGVKEAGGMLIKLEIEPAPTMFMQMHGMWMEMKPEKSEIHH